MYLKKIAKSRVKTGDFIIVHAPFPDEVHPFRFQYSGTAIVNSTGLRIKNSVIDKFDRQGNWVRLPSKRVMNSPYLLMDGDNPGDTYFKVADDDD